jgi:hypothetical protein
MCRQCGSVCGSGVNSSIDPILKNTMNEETKDEMRRKYDDLRRTLNQAFDDKEKILARIQSEKEADILGLKSQLDEIQSQINLLQIQVSEIISKINLAHKQICKCAIDAPCDCGILSMIKDEFNKFYEGFVNDVVRFKHCCYLVFDRRCDNPIIQSMFDELEQITKKITSIYAEFEEKTKTSENIEKYEMEMFYHTFRSYARYYNAVYRLYLAIFHQSSKTLSIKDAEYNVYTQNELLKKSIDDLLHMNDEFKKYKAEIKEIEELQKHEAEIEELQKHEAEIEELQMYDEELQKNDYVINYNITNENIIKIDYIKSEILINPN